MCGGYVLVDGFRSMDNFVKKHKRQMSCKKARMNCGDWHLNFPNTLLNCLLCLLSFLFANRTFFEQIGNLGKVQWSCVNCQWRFLFMKLSCADCHLNCVGSRDGSLYVQSGSPECPMRSLKIASV